MAWLALDEFGFDHVLAAQPGVALVMFGTAGCGACRGWHGRLPLWLHDTATSLFYVDVATSQGLARRFELFHLPAFVLYRDGGFHRHFVSVMDKVAVQEAIAYSLSLPAEDEP